MKYRRNYVRGGTYFFTVNLLDRSSNLLTERITELRSSVAKVKEAKPFEINAWVVLPDHMHCVWTLPPEDADYSGRWRAIKKHFVKSIPQGEALDETRSRKGERGIWQRRFWEHTIRDEADYQSHIEYVYYNPVKHGYVDKVIDWPYSSFHRDVKQGIFNKDWGQNL